MEYAHLSHMKHMLERPASAEDWFFAASTSALRTPTDHLRRWRGLWVWACGVVLKYIEHIKG